MLFVSMNDGLDFAYSTVVGWSLSAYSSTESHLSSVLSEQVPLLLT